MSRSTGKHVDRNARGANNMSRDYNKIATVCLRFRNKGNVVDTIQEHINVINNKGSVYWGWWAKPYESVIPDLIDKINEKIRTCSVKFYLINPTNGKYYKAEAIHILHNRGSKISCPDQEKAPMYYNSGLVKMWIEIKTISEIEDPQTDLFSNYSFMCSYEHVEEKSNVFDYPFDGKCADCIEAFTMQNVSIWFLRKRDTKKDQKISKEMISLWREHKKKRTIFPKSYYNTKTNKIMLLSDPHFGPKHVFTNGVGEYDGLSKAIIAIADKKEYSGLIISGDFAWQAKDEEFKEAEQFIKVISEYYNLCPEQIAIVPGNHDIRFRDDDQKGPEASIEFAPIEAQEHYKKFFKNIYPGLSTEEKAFCLGRRISLKYGYQIEIICLDSNILEQDKDHFVGQGFVGMEQIERVKMEMELSQRENHLSYRILVLHHHILAAWFQEDIAADKFYSVVIDSGRLLKFIKDYRIDLVIHGHNHANLMTEITLKRDSNIADDYDHTFNIIAVGSAGAKGVPNSMGELVFKENGDIEYVRRKILTREKNEAGEWNGKEEYKQIVCNYFERHKKQ